MREIKFRAYDIYTKIMLPVVDIIKFTKSEEIYITRNGAYGVGINIQYQPNIEIMQYTGLHDKNGKEIYEGDIVEYVSRYRYIVCSGEYNTNPKNCTEAIILGIYLKEIKTEEEEHLYCINGVAARFPAHCSESERGIENLKLEVIGNIYENKELLEG